jgi:hypothetical protein
LAKMPVKVAMKNMSAQKAASAAEFDRGQFSNLGDAGDFRGTVLKFQGTVLKFSGSQI